MKKRVLCIIAMILIIIALTGCRSNDNPDYSVSRKDNYMTMVEEGADYRIYVDDQGVMYYQMYYGNSNTSRMALTAMINPDGTARLWEEKDNN